MNQKVDLLILVLVAAFAIGSIALNVYQWLQTDQLNKRLVNLQQAYSKVQIERDDLQTNVTGLTL